MKETSASLRLCVRHLPLVAILLLAFGLRWFGWNWDEGHYLHPDERHVAMVTAALERPDTFREWLDGGTSTFTPYTQGINSYVYGQLPVALVHHLTVAQGELDLREIIKTGRFFSALFSSATVLLVYLFGCRLVSVRFAQLAALLQACVVLSIQQAHFYTVDSAGTFFATACVGFGLLHAKEKSFWPLLLSGALVGLAVACRVNLGLLAIWVTAVALISAGQNRSWRPIIGLAGGGFCALLLFRVLHPMAFSGWGLNPEWIRDLKSVHDISRGILEVPFTLQWVGRTPFIYALRNLIVYSIGLPLGVMALGGVGVGLWSLRHRRLDWKTLAALWPLMLFIYHSRIFLHTQRYFLPAIPVLVWCGVLALHRIRPIRVGRLIAGITVFCALFYAVAFSKLYRAPHPRVQASEWLYKSLPLGGTVLTEHWDDALPLRLDVQEKAHRQLTLTQAEVYQPETAQKIRQILEQIDQADFLVLSSTRASLSIPRLPMRYPVMSRFYEDLTHESSRLELKEVARFHREPHLAGFRINSLNAEEAYRVYDHPLVRIYEKTPEFNPDRIYQTLTQDIDFATIPRISYLQANRSHAGWLTAEQIERRKSGPKWSDLYSLESFGSQHPILVWTLVLFALGPLTFPLTFFLFPNLQDRGASVSRLFGLCLIAWAAWLPAAAEIIPFQISSLMAAMSMVGLSAAITVFHHHNLLSWIRWHWRNLLPGEILLWTAFAAFLLLRSQQPELWHPWAGGEKPMDFAYLNATSLTNFFPPANPWLSGAFVHYYYYGFVLVSVLSHLTGIPPEIAYNLALATFACFTAGAAYGLGNALTPLFRRGHGRRGGHWAGVLCAFFVMIPGNLAQVREYLSKGFPANHREVYWNASRAIQVPPGEVAPITEFPLFSHLYGDLHAHVMALPLAMLCALLSWQLLRRFHLMRILAFSLILGTVWVTNTWDLPIQAAIFLFACLFPMWGDRNWAGRIMAALGGLFLAKMLFAPFHQNFSGHPLVVQFWQGPRSSLLDLFLMHGLFLVPLTIGLILWRKSFKTDSYRTHLFPLLLTAGSLAVILMLEIIHMEHDIGRMNFVFKFSYQIWWILASVTAILTVRFAGRRHMIFTSITGLLILCGMVYPLTAIPAKLNEWRWITPGHTLDGMAYMDNAIWEADGSPVRLADDKAAINWLRKHADPMSVIMEAQRPLYQWGGRISWHTGLPAVLGWDWHMRQQRSWPGGHEAIHQRKQDIQRFHRQADPSVLDRYQVNYVIVGDLERHTYGTESLVKISRLPNLIPAFTSGGTTIYEIIK